MKPKCPVCKTEIKQENNLSRPFCSKRCKLIDLGAWLDEQYRIPGQPINENQKKEAENNLEVTH